MDYYFSLDKTERIIESMKEKENHKQVSKLEHHLILIVLPNQQRKISVRPRETREKKLLRNYSTSVYEECTENKRDYDSFIIVRWYVHLPLPPKLLTYWKSYANSL